MTTGADAIHENEVFTGHLTSSATRLYPWKCLSRYEVNVVKRRRIRRSHVRRCKGFDDLAQRIISAKRNFHLGAVLAARACPKEHRRCQRDPSILILYPTQGCRNVSSILPKISMTLPVTGGSNRVGSKSDFFRSFSSKIL